MKSLPVCLSVLLTGALCASAQLRAGAGKADITPDPANLPAPYIAIHDHLYARVILIRTADSSALLMNMDVGGVPQAFNKDVSQEISQRYNVPLDNILISATHDHASVLSWQNYLPPSQHEDGPMQARQARAVMTPAIEAFDQRLRQGVLSAVDQAQSRLEDAEIGFGVGELYLNTNRDAIDAKTRQWVQDANLEYPSDKTLAVVEFRRKNGDPIAVYMNYAMHAVTMFLRNEISGDFPGVAARYLEDVYDDKIVAVWTSGAAGDQNPIYRRPITAIGDQTIRDESDPSKPAAAESTGALFRMMFGTNKRPPQPPNPKLAEQSWQIVQAMGTLMAEETIRVMGEIPHFSSDATIQGSSKILTCPGRKQTNAAFMGSPGTYEDAAPVEIRVGALRLGEIALGSVNAELYSNIGKEVKQNSPFRDTIVVTLTDGRAASGYIPTDDAYARYSFEVVGTSLKAGCAETGIVTTIDGMLQKDMSSSER